MTREQLLKHWHVIEAFRNGKQVQYRLPSVPSGWAWSDSTNPDFSLGVDYRIKPEPKKMWVNVYPGPDNSVYGAVRFTRENADIAANTKRIACVEVTYTEGEGL